MSFFVGSIVKRDDLLFLVTKLVRTSDGAVLSTDEYRVEESKLIELQEEVSSQILSKIKSSLTDEEKNKLGKKDTENAEAEIEEGGQTLGEAGSRVVAETFVALLKLSKPSILNEDFQPNPDFGNEEGEFGMRQMLKFIRDSNKDFDELNPIKDEVVERWSEIIARQNK